MAKKKTVYLCNACQHEESKWLGRCPQCGTWNSFNEQVVANTPKSAPLPGAPRATSGGHSIPLASLEAQADIRIDAGLSEVNQVLGGGIIRGASVLIGGEPGIGKSTLLLQLAAKVKTAGRVLYITGEESAAQIKMRADRLGISRQGLEILVETHVPVISNVLEKIKPVLVIVDSIQTLYNPEAGEVPGTVNQLKYGCHEILSWCKEHETSSFLIAHVTKGGQIAGPKVIEHMVDTVLHFEQAAGDIRILRATKNRFGSVDEVGLFTMDEHGLSEVTNPASIFLIQREGELPPGISVAPIFEGSRALLVELQALTVPAKGGMSRVFSDRIDSGRVSRIAAILEKHTGLKFSEQDLYVNVAGGMRINDPGADLPLALALYSARTGQPLPAGVASAGELSLAGEVRPTTHLRRRVKAANDLGYHQVVVPEPGKIRRIQDALKSIWKE